MSRVYLATLVQLLELHFDLGIGANGIRGKAMVEEVCVVSV